MLQMQLEISDFLPYFAALCAAYIVYFTIKNIRFEKRGAARVRAWTQDASVSRFDRYGDKVAGRLKLNPLSVREHLYWAQLGGHYKSWSVGGVFARGAVFGGGGLMYAAAIGGAPVFYVAAVIPFVLPFLMLRSKANEVRKAVKRVAPEIATVLAAEMGAGASPEQAVVRCSEIPGPLGDILRQAVTEARAKERTLFSVGLAQGVLKETLHRQKIPVLTRLGSQMDRLAALGVETSRSMFKIAEGFAREYRAEVQKAAAQMDNQLMAPMAIFFFVPFIASIMLPLAVAMFASLGM